MARGPVALFVVSCLVLSAPALAQETGCQKRAGAVCGAGDAGRVAPFGGEASLSHGGDFTPIKTEARLRFGDRVLLGDQGARLELGKTCAMSLAPGSLATITRQGNLICASEFSKTPKGIRELGDDDDRRTFFRDDAAILTSIASFSLIGAGIGIAIHDGSEKPAYVSAR